MSSILHKYFSEMDIDVSWYKKCSHEKITTSNSEFDDLRKIISKCEQCDLYKTRNKTVFGSGPLNSKIMVHVYILVNILLYKEKEVEIQIMHQIIFKLN